MNRADKKLAKAVLKGDSAACRSLFESYYPRVYRFLSFRMQNHHHDVEDLAQQVMHDVLRSLHSYKGKSTLLTWMITITRRRYAGWLERQTREDQLLAQNALSFELLISASEEGAAQPPGPAHLLEMRQLVSLALDLLPPHYSELLEHKYMLGYSTREIAHQLQISSKAVESRLTRAREAFKTAVDRLIPEALEENSYAR